MTFGNDSIAIEPVAPGKVSMIMSIATARAFTSAVADLDLILSEVRAAMEACPAPEVGADDEEAAMERFQAIGSLLSRAIRQATDGPSAEVRTMGVASKSRSANSRSTATNGSARDEAGSHRRGVPGRADLHHGRALSPRPRPGGVRDQDGLF